MPMIARTKSWPERANPKAATEPKSGISNADKGPDKRCHHLARISLVLRPAASKASMVSDSSQKLCESGSTDCRSIRSGLSVLPTTSACICSVVAPATSKRTGFSSRQPGAA